MAHRTIPREIAPTITRYVEELKKDRLPIEQVILFGSYAKGKARKGSDVDLCVISPQFTDSFEAIQYLNFRESTRAPYPIEAIGMTREALAERTTLAREIRDTGVPVCI